jgi:hypothetical protein
VVQPVAPSPVAAALEDPVEIMDQLVELLVSPVVMPDHMVAVAVGVVI